MTELNPGLILQAGKYEAPDFAQTLGQIGQLKAQQGQQALQAQQLGQLARQNQIAEEDRATAKDAGAKYASGDASGAISTAAAGGNMSLVGTLQKMRDDQRETLFKVSQRTAPRILSLSRLDPSMRPAALRAMAPDLAAAGLDEAHIAAIDTSDAGLQQVAAGAQTIGEFQTQANRDREFAHTVVHDAEQTATTRRGQDLTHGDAAAGRAVTMRGQNMTDARMKAIQAGSALTPDDVQFYAEQVAAGDTSPLMNLGRGAQGPANVVAIRNKAAEIQRSQGLTGADAAATSLAYGGQKAGARTVGNMGAKIDSGVNELAASIPLAAQASAALPRGQFVPLNKVKQMIAAGNGDPALKDFAVKSQAALNAYNMVAARGGSSVGEREHNATLLMTADSPAAYQAALNAMAQEGKVAKTASHQTMIDVTGRRRADAKPAGKVVSWADLH